MAVRVIGGDDAGLLLIGVARGTEAALARLFALLPLPMQAPVVVAVQGADRADVRGILEAGPPGLRLAADRQPLSPGGLWLAPPGVQVRIDDDVLVCVPLAAGATPGLAPLFASAAGRRVVAVLLGDTGADGVAAAAALGDAPLLRPDSRQLPVDGTPAERR